ncbi:MAG: hypothetical protein AB2L14_05210 [Candidatus Xenobiia bacterium LiM19]
MPAGRNDILCIDDSQKGKVVMGAHILLNGRVFEEKYLNLGIQFPEERWQEILSLTSDDMDADMGEYMGNAFALLCDGTRTVQKGKAVLQIYRACVAECRITEYRSWTCDSFWADMENGGYGTREVFWPRLREKGQSEAYLSLLRTIGLGLAVEPASRHPWWLFGKGAINGRYYGEWAALTPPDEARRIIEHLNDTGVIENVLAAAYGESPDLAKSIERDHREVVRIIDRAGSESHWVLGFEFGT